MDMKRVKALYDLKSFEGAAAYAKKHFKDDGGIILARNLEHVSEEIFTQEYADLTFLNQGLTINNEGGYATSIRKLKLRPEGDYRESGTNTQTTGKITLTLDNGTAGTIYLWAELGGNIYESGAIEITA